MAYEKQPDIAMAVIWLMNSVRNYDDRYNSNDSGDFIKMEDDPEVSGAIFMLNRAIENKIKETLRKRRWAWVMGR